MYTLWYNMLQIIAKREERQLIVSCKELRNALHSNVVAGRIACMEYHVSLCSR